jgi:hypothetical protein
VPTSSAGGGRGIIVLFRSFSLRSRRRYIITKRAENRSIKAPANVMPMIVPLLNLDGRETGGVAKVAEGLEDVMVDEKDEMEETRDSLGPIIAAVRPRMAPVALKIENLVPGGPFQSHP